MSSIRILIGPYIKSEQFRNTFIMFACPTELNMHTLSSNQLNNATQDLEFWFMENYPS